MLAEYEYPETHTEGGQTIHDLLAACTITDTENL